MIQLWRIMHAGLRNFLRNAWLSSAATAVMAVTLTIMLTSYISNIALTFTLKGVVDKIDVSAYFNDDTTLDQIKDVENRLLKLDNVKSVKYTSKADALTLNANNPDIINSVKVLGYNPLPQSLQVKAKDPNKLDPIVDFFNASNVKPLLQAKNPLSYTGAQKKTVDSIVGFIRFMQRGGLFLSALFIVISTLIIFNTIRMAIFTRRDEIEIMKLVGATKWFIRGPFIFEAAVYGVIGAALALLVGYGLILAGVPALSKYIDAPSTMDFFRSHSPLIILTTLAAGIVIGSASSLLAIRRYLRL